MSDDGNNITRALVYGSIATGIVSVLSLGGAFIIPLLKGPKRQKWMNFFIAMAVATLSSDAILHIIPQILGIHNHGSGDEAPHNHEDHGNHTHEDEEHDHLESHGHSHTHEVEHHHHHGEEDFWYSVNSERVLLIRLSVILIVVFFLYLIDFFFYHRKKASLVAKSSKSSSIHITEENRANGWPENGCQSSSSTAEANDDEVTFFGLKSRAIVILFGDAIHNSVDGVAIGASFLVSTRLGIVTTIAVACHELPHELGDLAVLLDSGLSMCRALTLNLISALTAFIGLYVSIALGHNETAEQLLLALTAAMFLYVAWIDMLSHLKHDCVSDGHWITAFFLQLFGFLLGFAGIFALAWFEDQLFY